MKTLKEYLTEDFTLKSKGHMAGELTKLKDALDDFFRFFGYYGFPDDSDLDVDDCFNAWSKGNQYMYKDKVKSFPEEVKLVIQNDLNEYLTNNNEDTFDADALYKSPKWNTIVSMFIDTAQEVWDNAPF